MTKKDEIEDAGIAYIASQMCTDVDNDVLNNIFEEVGMKRIYTSNYSRCAGHENAVSISASTPKDFTGKHIAHLAPTWDIITPYKLGLIGPVEYAELYLKILTEDRGLTAKGIFNDIPHGTIMLCYEKPNQFCHRRVLAEWLERELGVEIPEWQSQDEADKLAVVDSLINF